MDCDLWERYGKWNLDAGGYRQGFLCRLLCYFCVLNKKRKERGHRERNKKVPLEMWFLMLKELPLFPLYRFPLNWPCYQPFFGPYLVDDESHMPCILEKRVKYWLCYSGGSSTSRPPSLFYKKWAAFVGLKFNIIISCISSLSLQ